MKLIFLLQLVNSYGYAVHTYLGKLIDSNLDPEIRYRLYNDLNDHSLAQVSVWADKVKNSPKYSWTKQLHYIDILQCNNQTIPEKDINNYCENNCVTSAILDFTKTLRSSNLLTFQNTEINLNREETLKFLIHFLQDFNQPMHLLGYDHGGNQKKIKIDYFGKIKKMNYHSLWDNLVPEYYISKYTFTPDPIYNFTSNIKELLYEILDQNLHIACSVYINQETLVFSDYFKKEQIDTLFNNYFKLIINVLHYIYM